MPTFSVIIPCHNRGATVRATLLSVKAQTYPDFECIVVDDGSYDGDRLKEVVDGLGDARFRYIWRENGGGGAARNTGLDAACGEYIAFLDSDDLFAPHKLERFASVITDANPMHAYYSQALVERGVKRKWVRPDRAILPGEDMAEYLFVHNQFVQTSTMVLSASVARLVRFDPSLRKGQDLDFCVRLHAAGVRFLMLHEPLVVWADKSEVNRTSRTIGHSAPTEWLNSVRSILTAKALHGYRATVLSYYLASEHPLKALYYLARGWVAGVPARVVLRHTLRCFVGRSTYRRLVNTYVALRGRSV